MYVTSEMETNKGARMVQCAILKKNPLTSRCESGETPLPGKGCLGINMDEIDEIAALQKKKAIRECQQMDINEAIDGTLKIQVKWMERITPRGREMFQIAIGPYEGMKCIFGHGSIELKTKMPEGEHRISILPEWREWRRTHDPEKVRDECEPKPVDQYDLSTRTVWHIMRGTCRDDTR